MEIKWLSAILILIVFISGCLENGKEIKPTYSDNALKMEIRIREKEEGRRILPDQTIRMTITLTNQVEHETNDVYLRISDPHGILVSKVDCGPDCVCEMSNHPSGCCYYNGCYYDSIQSLDQEEITFGLKLPDEEQISAAGRELKPEIMLEYVYDGTSILYVPIYESGEKPVEPKKEFTWTTGPIRVDIDSDNWVGEGDLFPIYVDVNDVAHSSEELMIPNDAFQISIEHADIEEDIGRCDFDLATMTIEPETCADVDRICDRANDCTDTDGYECHESQFECTGQTPCCCAEIGATLSTTPLSYYIPEENITLPQRVPLVCTLRAKDISVPMVKASITIGYSYEYKVKKAEKIRVEKAILGIF